MSMNRFRDESFDVHNWRLQGVFLLLRGNVSDFNIDGLGVVSYSSLKARKTHFLLSFDYWLHCGPNTQDLESESIT